MKTQACATVIDPEGAAATAAADPFCQYAPSRSVPFGVHLASASSAAAFDDSIQSSRCQNPPLRSLGIITGDVPTRDAHMLEPMGA